MYMSKINNQVKCETCKHKVDREDAQEVILTKVNSFADEEKYIYYCQLHTKPYKRKESFSSWALEGESGRYFKEVEVNQDGIPLELVKCRGELEEMIFDSNRNWKDKEFWMGRKQEEETSKLLFQALFLSLLFLVVPLLIGLIRLMTNPL